MPKIKLTPKFVTSVTTTKPKEKYQDSIQNGLVLRVTPNSKVYYFIATITVPSKGKKQIEKKIGRAEDIPLSAARERAKAYLSAYISQSSDPMFAYTKQKTVRGKLPKLAEVYQKWLVCHEKQKATSSYENMKNGYSILAKNYTRTDGKGKTITVTRGFADLRLDEITGKKISAWQKDLIEIVGQKPSSINRVCLELKHLLMFAVDEGLTDDNYSIPEIQKLSEKEIDAKTDYLKIEEIKILKEGLERYVNEAPHGKYDMSYIRDIVLFLLYTGMRPASVCGLQWRDVDFEREIITMRASNIKTKRTDTIIPSRAAMEILERLRAEREYIKLEDNIFTNYSADMICRKVKKVMKFIFGEDTKHSAYTLRHTFATHLSQCADLSIVKRALNHRRIDTTLKYISIDGERVSEAVNQLPFNENATNNNNDNQQEESR